MIRNTLLILLFTSLTCFTKAQAVFNKSYDLKTRTEFQRVTDIVMTYDSAFVIACESYDSTFLVPTLELVKISSSGQFIWRQTFQFPEFAFNIQLIETPDSGLVITTTTNFAVDSTAKIAMLKTDKFGVKQWVKLLGDNNITQHNFSLAIKGNSIFTLSRGSLKLGNNQYEPAYFIAKTDLNGNISWFKKFNWQGSPYPKAMTISNNKEIYVAGEILSGGRQFALSKIDSSGSLIWSKVSGPNHPIDPWDMKLDSAENLIITGRSKFFNPSAWDIFLIKIDTSGNFIWGRNFGNGISDLRNDEGYVVYQNQNGYMICAEPETFGNKSRAALIQTNFNGKLQWMKIYGDTTGSFPNGAIQLNDGYVIYGVKGTYGAYAPIYLIKTDLNGLTSCKYSSVTLPDSSFSISFVDTGTTGNVQGIMTFDYTEQVNSLAEFDECESMGVESILTQKTIVQTFPNPFYNKFTLLIQNRNIKQLSITIRNILGQTVFNEQVVNFPNKRIIDLQGEPNGIYFLDLIIDGERFSTKVLKQ